MSDLADAVFGGQLLGHVINGEELTLPLVHDAALNAELADGLVVDDQLSPQDLNTLSAKTAQTVISSNGLYDTSDFVDDHSFIELASDLLP